ncbi:MAG: GGDEF domain-containing protein [Pseudomonadaceae bacterium]|nr:MAG: GGDEF domain-containing protein [Pseudomonadaceae bacterium]
MIAHTPTIFASVAWVALIMAFCLLVVGRFNQRDGLLTAGAGLLAHALAYVCFMYYGQAPLWLTYSLPNTLLAVALAFYSASIFRINQKPVPWLLVFSPPIILGLLMILLLNTNEPRMLAASGVLMVQCLLIILWAQNNQQPDGRAHLLLIVGAAVSLVGILIRVIAIATGLLEEMRYDISNIRQSISISLGTVTVMMLSLGLVLLSKERIEGVLKHMAMRDPLTDLPNRRAVMEQMDSEIERARRNGSTLAVAIIDIDHFKNINDIYGHLAGDAVLKHCAKLMKQRLRQSDGLGRYGGEEFLLLLPDTSREGAAIALDDLRAFVANTPTRFGDLNIPQHFSVGVWCGVPSPQDSGTTLLGKADTALYKAKNAGRNTLKLSEDITISSIV